jgi:hypothetical protein
VLVVRPVLVEVRVCVGHWLPKVANTVDSTAGGTTVLVVLLVLLDCLLLSIKVAFLVMRVVAVVLTVVLVQEPLDRQLAGPMSLNTVAHRVVLGLTVAAAAAVLSMASVVLVGQPLEALEHLPPTTVLVVEVVMPLVVLVLVVV